MKRSDFFRTLFGGLAGIAVAPLLNAEPKIEKSKLFIEPEPVFIPTGGELIPLEIDPKGHLRKLDYDPDPYQNHITYGGNEVTTIQATTGWTATTTNDYTATRNFTIVNSAGDEFPLVQITNKELNNGT